VGLRRRPATTVVKHSVDDDKRGKRNRAIANAMDAVRVSDYQLQLRAGADPDRCPAGLPGFLSGPRCRWFGKSVPEACVVEAKQ
jgi:hypothetical protein